MANYLITGYWGEPHVTAENDRGIHAGIFGEGRVVLPVGRRFQAEYIGNNTIRMYDGKLVDGGSAAGIPAGEYVDFLIANASQGMKRNDLIVFQYQKDSSTQVETGSFVVVQGTETSGTPADPALTQGDLLSGKASLEQMALWRVVVSGTAIAAPVQVFSIANTAASVPDWAMSATKPEYTKSEVGLGNVDNVKQYSASNPPPYPVTSVNGQTGAVTLEVDAAGVTYSTTAEVATGDTWYDGKPIYQMTFTGTLGKKETTEYIGTMPAYDTIIEIVGVWMGTGGVASAANYYFSSSIYNRVHVVADGKVAVYSSDDVYVGRTIYATIKYTKADTTT